MTHDRRLGYFRSQTLGLGATYNLPKFIIPGFERTSINLHWDYINFDHDDFRDLRVSAEDSPRGRSPFKTPMLKSCVSLYPLSFKWLEPHTLEITQGKQAQRTCLW